MADLSYMQGRKKYARPQAMLWANNPGTVVEDEDTGEFFHIPLGNEINSGAYDPSDENEFLILSDHNRQPLDFSTDRIENKKRMSNGRMRSYYIADKISISTSWNMLPSRSFSNAPLFSSSGKPSNLVTSIETTNFPSEEVVTKRVSSSGSAFSKDQEYTADGGAGGVDLLDWYERYTGSFWVYLSYDKHINFRNLEDPDEEYGNLNKYNQIVEVFFNQFAYKVVKRGGSNFDFWDINVDLEEV